jgi:hypothetical protein
MWRVVGQLLVLEETQRAGTVKSFLAATPTLLAAVLVGSLDWEVLSMAFWVAAAHPLTSLFVSFLLLDLPSLYTEL